MASLGKLGDVGGDSGVSCCQDASFLAPLRVSFSTIRLALLDGSEACFPVCACAVCFSH